MWQPEELPNYDSWKLREPEYDDEPDLEEDCPLCGWPRRECACDVDPADFE